MSRRSTRRKFSSTFFGTYNGNISRWVSRAKPSLSQRSIESPRSSSAVRRLWCPSIGTAVHITCRISTCTIYSTVSRPTRLASSHSYRYHKGHTKLKVCRSPMPLHKLDRLFPAHVRKCVAAMTKKSAGPIQSPADFSKCFVTRQKLAAVYAAAVAAYFATLRGRTLERRAEKTASLRPHVSLLKRRRRLSQAAVEGRFAAGFISGTSYFFR